MLDSYRKSFEDDEQFFKSLLREGVHANAPEGSKQKFVTKVVQTWRKKKREEADGKGEAATAAANAATPDLATAVTLSHGNVSVMIRHVLDMCQDYAGDVSGLCQAGSGMCQGFVSHESRECARGVSGLSLVC